MSFYVQYVWPWNFCANPSERYTEQDLKIWIDGQDYIVAIAKQLQHSIVGVWTFTNLEHPSQKCTEIILKIIVRTKKIVEGYLEQEQINMKPNGKFMEFIDIRMIVI